ncbi:MAG: glycosyltransferase [Ferruginibacter sp.]|nr:glycosyltransferase [Ferruginibacter sp.]
MRILILAPSEICYHPRLLKAADFFIKKGDKVVVFNSITGLASKEVYDKTTGIRNWVLYENDISKRTFGSKIRWLFSSVVFKLNYLFLKFTGKWLFFQYGLSRSFILFPSDLKKQAFDYIYINLVDTLPLASSLQKKTGAAIIYDCQEYFKGQSKGFNDIQYKWVVEAENKYASLCRVVLGTTAVMVKKLEEDFGSAPSYFRVRNLPLKSDIAFRENSDSTLKLIWHGLNIVPENVRGVHILLQAVSVCKTPVHLYLQGHINGINKAKLDELMAKLNIAHLVTVIDAADPDCIVESLIKYDVGLAGELAAEENQMLTSSNKLFEYIYAGLAVIMPDLPGLAETVNDYSVGELYEQGDFQQLADKIDSINNNRVTLNGFKNASRKAAKEELFWENDFGKVWQHLNKQVR